MGKYVVSTSILTCMTHTLSLSLYIYMSISINTNTAKTSPFQNVDFSKAQMDVITECGGSGAGALDMS